MRYPLVIGNWKLNGNYHMVREVFSYLCKKLSCITKCTIVVAPPEIYLDLARHVSKDSNIVLGAQNVDTHLSGSFTGETSAEMLKDIGVKYVIIGHSERRIYHNESNELIAKKFAILKEKDLVPVLCVGETKIENQTGKTEEVCKRQIDIILKTCGVMAFIGSVIAYEPIWAIGSGKSATPMQVQKVHKFIRDYIAKINIKVAEQIIIQYGGSVNVSNVKELLSEKDIDGVLVGNSSLKPNDFSEIIEMVQKIKNHSLFT